MIIQSHEVGAPTRSCSNVDVPHPLSHLLTSFVVLRQCLLIMLLLSSSPGTIKFWLSLKLTSSATATAFHQARRELRQLKEEARNKHAVSVIWAGWQGTKVFGKPVDSTCRAYVTCRLHQHPLPPVLLPSRPPSENLYMSIILLNSLSAFH